MEVLDPHNALAGRRLQPLGHFSGARGMVSKRPPPERRLRRLSSTVSTRGRTPTRSAICWSVSWLRNGGICALAVDRPVGYQRLGGLRLVEVRADVPVEPAASSVWQTLQPLLAKSALPAAASPFANSAAALGRRGVLVVGAGVGLGRAGLARMRPAPSSSARTSSSSFPKTTTVDIISEKSTTQTTHVDACAIFLPGKSGFREGRRTTRSARRR